MNVRGSEYNLKKSIENYIHKSIKSESAYEYVGDTIEIYNYDEMPSGMTELTKKNTAIIWKMGKSRVNSGDKRGYFKLDFILNMLMVTRSDSGNNRMYKMSDIIRDTFLANSNILVYDYINESGVVVNSAIILSIYDNVGIKELAQGFKMREFMIHFTMPI